MEYDDYSVQFSGGNTLETLSSSGNFKHLVSALLQSLSQLIPFLSWPWVRKTTGHWSSTSAYMGWRLHIWQTTACLSEQWRVDDTFDLLTVCLVVSRTRTALGTRNFVVAGPLVWNSLPANLRSASASLRTFAGKLKTYLFELPWVQLRTFILRAETWVPGSGNYSWQLWHAACRLHR